MVAVDSRLKLKTDRFPQAKLRFPAGSVRSIGELVRLAEFTSTRRRFRRQALACVRWRRSVHCGGVRRNSTSGGR
jgi:hypothetical protein